MNNQENEKPSYFAILPSTVRYDKRLKPIERIFFAEITALANKSGFCTASNSYFAKVFDITKSTASRYISNLAKYNYVTSVVDRDENNRVILRRIYPRLDAHNIPINSQSNTPIVQTNNTPIAQTNNTPIAQTSKENNTSINNTSINIRESENSDYIDFNLLIEQSSKVGAIAHIKAILQSELNYLTFDDFDNKIINRIINSIKHNLIAFKQSQKDYSSVTIENIVEAFKTSVNRIKSQSNKDSLSLSYINSCLNADMYINKDEKDDLSEYETVVRSVFSHYKKFTAFDKAKIRAIIDVIQQNDVDDVLLEFKSLFNNLPAYIIETKSYQSVSYIASKINELLANTSSEAQIKKHKNFEMLRQTFGEERAIEIISRTLNVAV